jgi:hypothetical protein
MNIKRFPGHGRALFAVVLALAFLLPSGCSGSDETETPSLVEIGAETTKSTYIQGEELDLSAITVTGTYSDGSQKPLAITGDNISGYDKDRIGDQTLTVTAEGKSAEFTVTVTASTNAAAEALNAAISKARADMTSITVSAAGDGSDVPAGTKWVTPAQKTALENAIAAAELAASGNAGGEALAAALAALQGAMEEFTARSEEQTGTNTDLPDPGRGGFTLIGPFTEPEGASIGDSFTIYPPPTLFNAEQTVTLSGDGYTDIKWYVDNLLVQEAGETLLLRARNFSQGRHYLSVEFIKEEKPFDIGLVFVVGGGV